MRKSELPSFIWRTEADAVLTAREACFGLRRRSPCKCSKCSKCLDWPRSLHPVHQDTAVTQASRIMS
eukprot:1443207-Prymnesium_polylepis.1